MKKRDLLDRVRVASPCEADWDQMTGNRQVRFCEHCVKQVHDLSSMTRADALALVERSNGRLCVRYVKRPDGTLRFSQTPHLVSLTRRAPKLAAGVFGVALGLSSVSSPAAPKPARETVVMASDPVAATSPGRGEGRGRVTGTVTDVQDAVVAGALVVLQDAEGRPVLQSSTNGEGIYTFDGVADGTYQVMVSSGGFRPMKLTNVVVQGAGVVVGDAQLEVSDVVEMGIIVMASPAEDLLNHSAERDARRAQNVEDLPDPPVIEAVQSGELSDLRAALRKGADVNARNGFGESALAFALYDREMLKTLVGAGAQLNVQDDFGVTPLMRAAVTRDASTLRLLVRWGADVHIRDLNGRQALMFAALDGNFETIKALVALGADVSAADYDGYTVLDYAAQNGNDEATTWLQRRGAKRSGKTSEPFCTKKDPESDS